MTETIKLKSPIDGSIYAERPVATDSQVNAAVERARAAQVEWAKTPIATRGKYMLAMLEALVGCVAGAPLLTDTERMMREAGLVDIALTPKPDYVEVMRQKKSPLYEQIAAHIPEGTSPADYVTSLDITARKAR